MTTLLAILWLFLGASICGALPADAMSKKPNPHKPAPVAVTPVPAPLPAPQPAPIDTGFNHGTAQGACWTPDPLDNNWTRICSSADTQTYYVSTSGSNTANTCLVQASPCQTIAYAVGKLRDGFPDHLLLKRGDTWTNETFGLFGLSGRSATEPMLLSYYGSGARPMVQTAAPDDFGIVFFGGGGQGGDFVAIVGLEFYAYTRDPSNPAFTNPVDTVGIGNNNSTSWRLIEDCKVSFYGTNIDFQFNAPLDRLAASIRRNIVVNAYSITSRSQGLHASGIVALTLTENFFDHNGWNADVVGGERNILNRNAYLRQGSGPVTASGNISTRSSSEGIQFRSGGTVTNNLFVSNSTGFDLGHQASDTGDVITVGVATNNVILKSDDIDGSTPRGLGIEILNASGSGIQVKNNIIAHVASPTPSWALETDPDTSGITAINNIIYDWGSQFVNDQGTGNTTTPNDINLGGYPAPNRTVGDYYGSIGGSPATDAGYFAYLAVRPLHTIDNTYTAVGPNTYIRAGFGQ